MNLCLFGLRNLWRQPSKTLMKIATLGIITATMIVWGSMSRGFVMKLNKTATTFELGDLQVHHKEYLASNDIYHTLTLTEDAKAKLATQSIPFAPRLFGYGLGAHNDLSAGVTLRGIDIAREKEVTTVHENVKQGQWLSSEAPQDVVIGSTLAKILNVKIGDKITVMAQATDGSLASERFTIRGTLYGASSDVDRRSVFMSEQAYRNFFLLDGGFHEIAIRNPSKETSLAELKQKLTNVFPTDEVKTWQELRPVLANLIDLQAVTGFITLIFIYIALSGFILNSMLMVIFDRMREYGTMKSVGMLPSQIFWLIMFETFWLAVFASLFALVFVTPCVMYLSTYGFYFGWIIDSLSFAGVSLEPILYAHTGPRQVILPISFLMVMMLLASIYPALQAAKINALRAIYGS
jgi:ABC-type lipoprotein release transport system permease subunit